MQNSPEAAVIIRPELLSRFPALQCGVSTRRGGVSPEPLGLNVSFNVGDDPENVARNRERFFEALGIPEDRLALPYQIHSAVVRRAEQSGRYESCDALVTNVRGLFLGVSVADCLPIFLYDPFVGAVAAVHSGWRGSRDKILLRALISMREEFGTRPENLSAYVGPGAGGCCYEVGEEVANKFPDYCTVREQDRRPRLDLKSLNKRILIDHGVDESNIEVSSLCTICTPDLLHSYRRDGAGSGRMMGVIGMAE